MAGADPALRPGLVTVCAPATCSVEMVGRLVVPRVLALPGFREVHNFSSFQFAIVLRRCPLPFQLFIVFFRKARH